MEGQARSFVFQPNPRQRRYPGKQASGAIEQPLGMSWKVHPFARLPAIQAAVLDTAYADSLAHISSPPATDYRKGDPAVPPQLAQSVACGIGTMGVLRSVAQRRERAVKVKKYQNVARSSYTGSKPVPVF
jgi:hypothetical protein